MICASRAILSYIMCVAMNRSFCNVILGGFGTGNPMEITGITTVWDVDQTVQAIADSKNIIVPRYGLAVAKGQYPVAEEVTILKAEGAKYLSQNTTSILPGTDSLVLSE